MSLKRMAAVWNSPKPAQLLLERHRGPVVRVAEMHSELQWQRWSPSWVQMTCLSTVPTPRVLPVLYCRLWLPLQAA